MSNGNTLKSFIPQIDGRGLDFIKGLAAILMVIDHMNFFWFGGEVVEMNLLGRAVFPLFCYALAVSLLRGNDSKNMRGANHARYFNALLLLALFSEPFIQLARPDSPINVVFTLALGVFAADMLKGLKDFQIWLFYIAGALLTMLVKIPMEFSLSGVLLPSCLLFVLQGKKGYLPFLLLLLFTINASGLPQAAAENPGTKVLSADTGFTILMLGICATVIPWFIIALGSMLPQNGRFLSRYALHVFYPAHQVLLWLLAAFVVGKS